MHGVSCRHVQPQHWVRNECRLYSVSNWDVQPRCGLQGCGPMQGTSDAFPRRRACPLLLKLRYSSCRVLIVLFTVTRHAELCCWYVCCQHGHDKVRTVRSWEVLCCRSCCVHRLCGGLFFSFYCVSTSRLRGGSSVHAVSCGYLQHEHGVYLPRRLHSMSCGHLQLQHRRHLRCYVLGVPNRHLQ